MTQQIIQRVLVLLGRATTASVIDGQWTALIRESVQTSYALLIARYVPYFARRTITLSALGVEDVNEKRARYSLPLDLVRIIDVMPVDSQQLVPLEPWRWQVAGNILFVQRNDDGTSSDDVVVDYGSSIVPENPLPALFTETLAYHICASISPVLLQSERLSQLYERRYEEHFIENMRVDRLTAGDYPQWTDGGQYPTVYDQRDFGYAYY